METSDLLEALGYASSPHCLRGGALNRAPDFGHVFRRARDSVNLGAVYTLRQPASGKHAGPIVPVTYVCKAPSPEAADEFHRLVWNQNVIPFLIVLTPQEVRVYSGFDWQRNRGTGKTGNCLTDPVGFSHLRKDLAAFSAESIDTGNIWKQYAVRPQQRVEWRLLDDLRSLEELITQGGFKETALIHALIGKFVYLYYLHDREILSNNRLALWDLTWPQVASRDAKIAPFTRVCAELDDRLNGSIFPLSTKQIREIGEPVLRHVASVFAGDSPRGQMHLDFKAYSFSHIPIETLSVIYEQFLHRKKTPDGSSAREDQAAYYTPIPVVNFIIDRMDEVRPLLPGMRVADFSCGSGAFLVQCYRRLIEHHWRTQGKKPRPTELKELLERHIFGMDVDAEACRVAELSLQLTLLDYVEPPDLLTANGHEHRFKLPSLTGTNIIEGNAFDEACAFLRKARQQPFEWIIGNPPWKGIKGTTASKTHKPVLDWIVQHKKDKPTGGNEAAEAFAWRTQEFAADNCVAGLLMPAMTLFKSESVAFRQRFFSENRLSYAANFANIREVLFAGRSRVPAAALIFHPNSSVADSSATGLVPVFSPLVANQELTRPRETGNRTESWNIVVDQDEVQLLSQREIRKGDGLTWKLAAWGSNLDERLLRRLSGFTNLGDWCDKQGFIITQGLELRGPPTKDGEPLDHHPDLAGRDILVTTELGGANRIFAFPQDAIQTVTPEETWVREGRYELPESVCWPPHILVSAARNWAVFSNRYLIVPPRQIGIAGNPEQVSLLKALALLLNSDLASYHQFFLSTQSGVQRERSNKRTLCDLPMPTGLATQDPRLIAEWAALHDALVAVSVMRVQEGKNHLVHELNERVNAAFALHKSEVVRVADIVHVMQGLHDGKVEDRAVRTPKDEECLRYAQSLKRELDAFIGKDNHGIQIWTDQRQSLGVIQIDLSSRDAVAVVHPRSQGSQVVRLAAEVRVQLESQFSQWRYFNRNLRLFTKNRIIMFKPLQRFHWLESRAVVDAGKIIALVLENAKGTG